MRLLEIFGLHCNNPKPPPPFFFYSQHIKEIQNIITVHCLDILPRRSKTSFKTLSNLQCQMSKTFSLYQLPDADVITSGIKPVMLKSSTIELQEYHTKKQIGYFSQ